MSDGGLSSLLALVGALPPVPKYLKAAQHVADSKAKNRLLPQERQEARRAMLVKSIGLCNGKDAAQTFRVPGEVPEGARREGQS